MSRIGDEIKRLMDEQELTISKVTSCNPIEYNSLKSWLTGDTLPSTLKLEVLAPALKTTIKHLREVIALDHRDRVAAKDKKDGLVKSPGTNDTAAKPNIVPDILPLKPVKTATPPAITITKATGKQKLQRPDKVRFNIAMRLSHTA